MEAIDIQLLIIKFLIWEQTMTRDWVNNEKLGVGLVPEFIYQKDWDHKLYEYRWLLLKQRNDEIQTFFAFWQTLCWEDELKLAKYMKKQIKKIYHE